MRVAIVQETVDARRGGAETSTLEMARHLARLGLDVTVLCRAAPDEVTEDREIRVQVVPVGGFSRALRTFQFLRRVGRICVHGGFDIVHAVMPCLAANVYQPRGGTYAETVQRGLAQTASPESYWLRRIGRQFNLRQRFLYRIENTLLRRRRHRVFVAAVSDYVRRQVVEGCGFPEERTRVIFNGVDVAPLSAEEIADARPRLREELGVSPGAPLVLFAAHNFKLKGLAELIRACALSAGRQDAAPGIEKPAVALASSTPWTVVVAGRDRPDHFRRLARRLGVAERARFVGAQRPMREWYAAADLLAHPTWYDPCSRVVLEALSLGLPVVTTRYDGAAEAFETGRQGEVIGWPEDIGGLAGAIGKCLRPEVREACRADAGRLRERLSMARHARELESLYRTVLAAEAGRRRER